MSRHPFQAGRQDSGPRWKNSRDGRAHESSPRFSLRSQVSTESLYGMKSVFFFFLFCGGGTFVVSPELTEAEGRAQSLQGGPQSQGCHSGRAGPVLKASPRPHPRAPAQAPSPRAGIRNLLACPSASSLVHPPRFWATQLDLSPGVLVSPASASSLHCVRTNLSP